jgi:hypothetical protein
MISNNVFDLKGFNPQLFAKYIETLPNLKKNELIKSGALKIRHDLAGMFPDQVGGNFITLPITGRIDGEPAKYDGNTDMSVGSLDTFMRGMVVCGFQRGWAEKDFTFSVTGRDFLEDIAAQVNDYWDNVDQKTIIAILEGIFNMSSSDAANSEFAETHTVNISELFDETTLNQAIQKAGGDNKNIYTTIIMHSQVATNLENMNLLSRLKYTDADGLSRDLNLGTRNGRRVIIDDDMPFAGGNFTSYVLGEGSFDYIDAGVKMPYELYRDPKTGGGTTELLTRQRKIFAPLGISFTGMDMVSSTPSMTELRSGLNWEVSKNSARTKAFPHKAIPVARIITKG